ncbi:hypothetical protein [Aromatoleum diolicum]|uniref:Uncharacterized protein n=1 Tax=Aromatoleum diolicum TaxID=75796 RepID=A0ABX1Q6L5_9RHOO|nr:hypothetical protein [Aromatoleum diolicum]NMG73633.1 hypothetical protein [Aromatoleum diolicum]
MLMRIATILAPMVSIVVVGYLYGRLRKPNMAIANQLALELFIPALGARRSCSPATSRPSQSCRWRC